MGRRWGKTVMSGRIVMNVLLQHGRTAWVAPTYKNSRPLWRWAETICAPAVKAGHMGINRAERTITTRHGGELAIYSGDNIDSIRGEAFNLVVMDEAAKLPEGAWTDAIMPTLADYDGDAILISTPRGRNWFYTEYLRAQGNDATAAAWTAPTTANPLPNIRKAAALARLRVPEDSYRQEWLAEFLESGGVFRNITAATTATAQDEAIDGHAYIIGCDWGQSNDFTVYAVIDINERALVHLDRFNQIDYELQKNRLLGLVRRFRPTQVIAESNSMGKPIIDSLVTSGAPVVPFVTTNATKAAAIQALQLGFETGDIRIIPDPVLISELQAYEMGKTATGMPKYSAPEGMHDDTVMALAIGWQSMASAWLAW